MENTKVIKVKNPERETIFNDATRANWARCDAAQAKREGWTQNLNGKRYADILEWNEDKVYAQAFYNEYFKCS